jgi:hypothetical protein
MGVDNISKTIGTKFFNPLPPSAYASPGNAIGTSAGDLSNSVGGGLDF